MELVCTNDAVARENGPFWNMVLCNVLGLANKHRTHEGAKDFQWFPGADVHLNFWHNKTKNSEDQVLLQIPFKTMSKSYVFGPHKRGNSTNESFWNTVCVCVRNIFSLANKHRTPQKHFSYFRRDFLSTLGFRTSGHGDVTTYYAWGLWWNIAIVNF